MPKSNVFELPEESVTIYLDRYTAQRLLLALTQALEGGGDYYKKKSKKGKGWDGKKGGKGPMTYGIKLTKGGDYGGGLKMSY